MTLKTLLRRTVLFAIRGAMRNRTYTIRHGLGRGLKRRGGLRFIPQLTPLSPEERFLLALRLENRVVYDIGGYEGVTTLFFARAVGPCGHVHTFEPHPQNHRHIVANVRINGFTQVTVWRMAIGRSADSALLAWRPSEIGAGSCDPEIRADAMRNGGLSISVDIDSVDNHRAKHGLPAPYLVKIDVEGLEYDVLLGMELTIQQCQPFVVVEIHGATRESKRCNARNVISLLTRHGYSLRHVESASDLSPECAERAMEGHIYASPPESQAVAGRRLDGAR